MRRNFFVFERCVRTSFKIFGIEIRYFLCSFFFCISDGVVHSSTSNCMSHNFTLRFFVCTLVCVCKNAIDIFFLLSFFWFLCSYVFTRTLYHHNKVNHGWLFHVFVRENYNNNLNDGLENKVVSGRAQQQQIDTNTHNERERQNKHARKTIWMNVCVRAIGVCV